MDGESPSQAVEAVKSEPINEIATSKEATAAETVVNIEKTELVMTPAARDDHQPQNDHPAIQLPPSHAHGKYPSLTFPDLAEWYSCCWAQDTRHGGHVL